MVSFINYSIATGAEIQYVNQVKAFLCRVLTLNNIFTHYSKVSDMRTVVRIQSPDVINSTPLIIGMSQSHPFVTSAKALGMPRMIKSKEQIRRDARGRLCPGRSQYFADHLSA